MNRLPSFVAVAVIASAALPSHAQSPVDRAVDKGVAYLKANIQGGNDPYFGGRDMLAGLALLEANVPTDDPVIKAVTKVARDQPFTQNRTYQLALAILFLDRLGDPKDTPLIQLMGVRLMAGQNAQGGWTYDAVPAFDATAMQQLKAALTEKVLTTDPPKKGEDGRPELRKEVVDYAQSLAQAPQPNQGFNPVAKPDDNSNTQFAVLATWVARKHGVPVDATLVRIDQRFRNSQDRQSGGWAYNIAAVGVPSTPSMTCAGLIGLAVGHGLAAEWKNSPNRPKLAARPTLAQDAAVRGALNFLAVTLAGGKVGNTPALPMGMGNGVDYYMLWSVERVGVIYGIDKIGPLDWYAIGSNMLIKSQSPDGSWAGSYAGVVDTSFAVLFLMKANAAKDLSSALRGRLGGNEMRSGAGPVDPSKLNPREGEPTVKEPPMRDPKEPALPTPNIQPRRDPGEADASRLAGDLLKTSGDRFAEILATLRDAKGKSYTEALTGAIDSLDGDAQKKARDALARRLTRMTPETLNEMLKNANREVRRAAALACAMKDDKSHIPELIAMLGETDPVVARAVKASLVSLSGRDFGPPADATAIDRAKAIADWRAWHKSTIK